MNKQINMLRKIRIIISFIVFFLATLLFLDFAGALHWLAKIQFIPALLAMNFIVILALVVITLLFGRIYCSVICPLGIFQDVISRISRKGKKNRFSYSPAISWLRYAALAVFIVTGIAGVSIVFGLLEPYSSYGRIVTNLFAPLYQLGNNLLAYFAERANSYMFYTVDVWIKGIAIFCIAAATFIIIIILAWRNGRTYCNTICPVGTVLGFLSRFSLFKPVIDTEKCNSCGLCARGCKASCINSKEHVIDYSRCVTCLNCIDKCNKNAITYTKVKPLRSMNTAAQNNDSSRRNFLSVAAIFASFAALKAQSNVDGGLAVIEDKKIPKRANPLFPAGAESMKHFAAHCTACQLCISTCPNRVLRPSEKLSSFMQPEMSYERGYCRPECVKCSEVCPTGAIKLITVAEKSSIQVGRAVWVKENCVAATENVTCNNCERHCPVAAIQMVPQDANNPDSNKIPAIDTERCIGCGACENLCPSRPFSAIYIEGNEQQRTV